MEDITVAAQDAAAIVIVRRVVHARVVYHCGKEGSLRDGELLCVDVEVFLAGGLHTVCAVSVVDRVEIASKDLLLAHLFVDLVGEEEFTELAGQGAVRIQVQDLDVLLGDGRAALQVLTASDLPGSTDHAADRDALVSPEGAVFGGDRGLLPGLRNLVEGKRRAVLDGEVA